MSLKVYICRMALMKGLIASVEGHPRCVLPPGSQGAHCHHVCHKQSLRCQIMGMADSVTSDCKFEQTFSFSKKYLSMKSKIIF